MGNNSLAAIIYDANIFPVLAFIFNFIMVFFVV